MNINELYRLSGIFYRIATQDEIDAFELGRQEAISNIEEFGHALSLYDTVMAWTDPNVVKPEYHETHLIPVHKIHDFIEGYNKGCEEKDISYPGKNLPWYENEEVSNILDNFGKIQKLQEEYKQKQQDTSEVNDGKAEAKSLGEYDVTQALSSGLELNVFESAIFYIQDKILPMRFAMDFAEAYIDNAGEKYSEDKKQEDLKKLQDYITNRKSVLNKSLSQFLSSVAKLKE